MADLVLAPDEAYDIKEVETVMDKLMNGDATMDSVLDFLKRLHHKAVPKGSKRGPKGELLDLVLRQRLRQLIQKYLGSALIKDGRIADLREALQQAEEETSQIARLSQEKADSLQRVEELQTELTNAIMAVENDVDKETVNMEAVAKRADEIVAKKEQAVEEAKQRLVEIQSEIAGHSAVLQEMQERLRRVREEEPIAEENAQHDELMAQLRAEVAAEKSRQDEQLEAVKKHLLDQTETEIAEIIKTQFQKDLDRAEKDEADLNEKLYAESIALKAARERLKLMKQEEELKDIEVDEHVAEFDKKVEEVLAPVRTELEELRQQIHASQVHANRKEEMERQLERLKRELKELEQSMTRTDQKMQETQKEFEVTIAQVRKDKAQKLKEAQDRYEVFMEEVAERNEKVNLGLEEQKAITKQAELKKMQVDNLYGRIAQLETGLKLKSSDIDLLQREINNTNESTRVHTEELYMAEKLQETAQKEQNIKNDLVAVLEAKLSIVQKMRANVEAARATVKDHIAGSDAGKKAMEAMKELDSSKLKLLNQQVSIRKEEIDHQKALTKNVREEIEALEKVCEGVEECTEASQGHVEVLEEHFEWLTDWALKMRKLPEKSIEKALLPRMAATVKAIEADVKALKNLNYAYQDRVDGTRLHAEVMTQRIELLTKMVEKLEKDKELAQSKTEMLENEIRNTDAETELQMQRQALLEADIVSHKERTLLLGEAMSNTEEEMRLHKMAAGIWQGKIKVVRDDTKVRDARIRVLDMDISRLRDLNEVREKTLEMYEQLNSNYEEAIEFDRQEAECLSIQMKSMAAKAEGSRSATKHV